MYECVLIPHNQSSHSQKALVYLIINILHTSNLLYKAGR